MFLKKRNMSFLWLLIQALSFRDRPSSHYDERAQNASSRPHSPRTPTTAPSVVENLSSHPDPIHNYQPLAAGSLRSSPYHSSAPNQPDTSTKPTSGVENLNTSSERSSSYFNYHNPFLWVADERSALMQQQKKGDTSDAESPSGVTFDYTDYTPVTSFQVRSKITFLFFNFIISLWTLWSAALIILICCASLALE